MQPAEIALEVVLLILISPQLAYCDANVALGRRAWQSSTFKHPTRSTTADNAVDGNTDPNIDNGSCAHGNDKAGKPNFWMVDLGQPMHIKYVVITNRDVTGERLDYFIVGVTNSSTNPERDYYPLCGQYSSTAANGAKLYLECNPNISSGQFVIVQQPANGVGFLTMCEVEIYTSQVQNTGKWKRHLDQRLVTNRTAVHVKSSHIHCIAECKHTPGCDSVNYRPTDKKCELNLQPHGVIACDLNANATGWNWWTQIFQVL